MTASWVATVGAVARRHAGHPDEADDLFQSACLAAVEAGRIDFDAADNQAWLAGVIRNKARMAARSAVRRKAREAGWQRGEADGTEASPAARDLSALAPSLRVTALLALNGATRAEIGWLLGLSDAALRQRISQLKRAIDQGPVEDAGLELGLPFGVMRRRMLQRLRQRGGFLASHDPDGHFFVVASSQNGAPRQH